MTRKTDKLATAKLSLIDESLLKSRTYTIRGIKVMLDADLAEIYGYTTKAFNQQVKNNIEKFDDDFRFQLTRDELASLKSELNSNWEGLRKRPFAFTEQGIYMLMTVLKGERAVALSKALIRLFKRMKDCIVENQQMIGAEFLCSKNLWPYQTCDHLEAVWQKSLSK